MFLGESIFTWQRTAIKYVLTVRLLESQKLLDICSTFHSRETVQTGKYLILISQSLCFQVTNLPAKKRNWDDIKCGAGLAKRLLYSTGIYEIEFQWHIEQFIESVPKVRILWRIETNHCPNELTTRCLRHCITIQLAFKRALGRIVLFYFADKIWASPTDFSLGPLWG